MVFRDIILWQNYSLWSRQTAGRLEKKFEVYSWKCGNWKSIENNNGFKICCATKTKNLLFIIQIMMVSSRFFPKLNFRYGKGKTRCKLCRYDFLSVCNIIHFYLYWGWNLFKLVLGVEIFIYNSKAVTVSCELRYRSFIFILIFCSFCSFKLCCCLIFHTIIHFERTARIS
jgi:hypothetical protein